MYKRQIMVSGLTLSKKGFEDDRERILDAIAKGKKLLAEVK